MPEPEFIDFDGDFRVNVYRRLPEKNWSHAVGGPNGSNDTNEIKCDTNDTKHDTNDTILGNEAEVLRLIRENPAITQKELKEKLKVSLATVKRLMADLQKQGLIERLGSSRKGQWTILSPKE